MGNVYFILLGLVPTIILYIIIYYLFSILWWLPFVLLLVPTAHFIGENIEPNIFVAKLQLRNFLKKALDKSK